MRYHRPVIFLLLLSLALNAAADVMESAFTLAADRIVEGFNNRDTQPFDEAVDPDSILRRVFDGKFLGPTHNRGAEAAIRQVITQQVGHALIDRMPPEARTKLLRLRVDSTEASALMRFQFGDEGNGYLDFFLALDPQGDVRIVDWKDHMTGLRYSESLRFLLAVTAPTPTVFGQLIDLATSRADTAEKIRLISDNYRKGEFVSVVNNYLSLDENLRRESLLVTLAINSAKAAHDEAVHSKLLEDIAAHSGNDDSKGFVLLDYFIEQGRYEKALAITDRLIGMMGVDDAGLLAMKSVIFFSKEEYERAVAEAERAIRSDHEYEDGYWALLNAQVHLKHFQGATHTAKILEDRFEYDLSAENLLTLDGFAPFIESLEYHQWRADR